ncbi:MAG: DUF2730 family protein [Alphaproteobacteria bacterium]
MSEPLLISAGTWAQWASAGAATVAVIISIVGNVRAARKSELALVHARISAVKETVAGHAERLARAESELEHLPTREMVAALAQSLARLDGKVEAMDAKFDGIRDRVNGVAAAIDQLVENELRGRGS